MELWPRANQPRELNLKGSVQLKTQADTSDEARMLQTNELRVEFTGGKKGEGGKLERAETLGAGSIEWTDAAAQSGSPGVPRTAKPRGQNCRRTSSKWNSGPRARRDGWSRPAMSQQ